MISPIKQVYQGIVFILLNLLFASGVFAQTLADAHPQVQVKAWLGKSASDSHAPTQESAYALHEQIILNIDISTSTWFLGSTQMGKMEVPNVIIKQRNSLATNYTEKKAGQTWSHQRWELTLYPQASGTYHLPSIPIKVIIAGEDGQKREHTLHTPELSFKAHLPSGHLTEKSPWFSASDVTLNQEWTQTQSELNVGDAITRTITITAADSLSILIPQTMTVSTSNVYQAYADPPQLADQSQRGEYSASRKDKVVYVMQQGGEVVFPSYQLQWWNTQTQQVETLTIEGKTFVVHHTVSSWLKAYWLRILMMVTCLCIICIVWIMVKRYYRSHPTPLWIEFRQALRQQDWPKVRLLLYIKLKRVKKVNTFLQTQELNTVSEALLTHHNKVQYRHYWQQIRPISQSKNGWLTPLGLQDKLDQRKK